MIFGIMFTLLTIVYLIMAWYYPIVILSGILTFFILFFFLGFLAYSVREEE